MSTQHTLEPWDLEPAPYPEDSGDGWYLHRGDSKEPLFLSAEEVSWEHARLIAAAPDLLAALQEVILRSEEDPELRFSVLLDKKALSVVRAAIAKATLTNE